MSRGGGAPERSERGPSPAERKRARLAREQELADLRAVMDTAAGRRFVWRLLEQCGVYREAMTGNSQTFHLLGMRTVGLWAIGELQAACPQAYIEMQQEALERDRQQQETSDG